MKIRRNRRWLVAALAAAVCAATAGADDRDFLRERAAKPNILILLDTSGSMVGTSEVATEFTLGDGLTSVDYGMLPGGGDDPRSRMGIAKAVLKDFLATATEANFALAGYQYEMPMVGTTSYNSYPAKNWTYEAQSGDRFGFVEALYSYRIGFAESYPRAPDAKTSMTNPSDFARDLLFGYNPYFNPTDGGAGYVRPYERYGPVPAPDVHPDNPFDLLPIYFMRNCESVDILGSSTKLCNADANRVFPFYTFLDRDGDKVGHHWTYSFSNCVPGAEVNGDDGCRSTWQDDLGTGTAIQWARRAHLEIPATDASGAANHPKGIDTAGNLAGNREEADLVTEDYDLDGNDDLDYDGDTTWDWLMRVDLVEERKYRECRQPQPSDTPTMTPSNTATFTPSNTPTDTPLPDPVCSDFEIGPMTWLNTNRVRIATMINNAYHTARHTKTTVTWTKVYPGQYVNFIRFNNFGGTQGTNIYNSPAERIEDIDFPPGLAEFFTTRWDGCDPVTGGCTSTYYLSGDIEVKFDYDYPGFAITCSETRTLRKSTPTMTPTITQSPTLTPSNTPVPATCNDLSVTNFRPGSWGMIANVKNSSTFPAFVETTAYTWFQGDPTDRIDWFSFDDTSNTNHYWGGNNNAGSDSYVPGEVLTTDPVNPRSRATIDGGATRLWIADHDGANDGPPSFGEHRVCFRISIEGGAVDGSDLPCDVCSDYWDGGGTPTPTDTATETPTASQTQTASDTPTASQTFTASPTFTASTTPTESQTFTPSQTATETATYTHTLTASETPTPSRTNTHSLTPSETQTFTPSETPTSSPSSTHTYSPSETPTFTPSDTATHTFTPSETATHTFTATDTATHTHTFTPTDTATFTFTPSPTNTPTFTPTPSPPEV